MSLDAHCRAHEGVRIVASQGQTNNVKELEQTEDVRLTIEEVEKELAKLLKSRRVRARKGAFKGFRSPPGRF